MEIHQLCRLCLVHEDVVVHIFNEQNTTSSGTLLKITACLPISVSHDDDLPKKICNRCSCKLNGFYDFVNTSVAAAKQLLNWLQPTETNGKSSIKQELIEGEVQGETDPLQFHVNYLSDDVKPQTILQTTREKERSKRASVTLNEFSNESNDSTTSPQIIKADSVKCKQEEINSGDLSDNQPIIKRKQKPKRKQLRKTNKNVPKLRTSKTVVRNATNTVNDDDDESTTKEETTIGCEVCNLRCKNALSLALHSSEHSADNKYTCPICQFQTPSRKVIRCHTRMHDDIAKYKCEVCQRSFTDSTRAREHKNVHTGEKPFQCEICGKSFTFSLALSVHRQTQHWETLHGTPMVKYDCTICNKHYTGHSALRRHKLAKHPAADQPTDQSVLCDTCGKRLSSKDKLRMHRRIHTGYKPFTCKFCSKCFTRSEQLRSHERTHTGEKPHVCTDCGRAFTQRTPLRIHQRSHTGERPYVCKTCSKGFVSKAAMDSHSRCCCALDSVSV